MTNNDVFHLVQINNPFQPQEQVRVDRPWSPLATLGEYFRSDIESNDVVLAVNGQVIPVDQYDNTVIARGDTVVSAPVILGGGGNSGAQGKQVLRLVVVLIVAYFTYGYGAEAAGAMMGSDGVGFAAAYGSSGVALANGAVAIGGSMLVNSAFKSGGPNGPANSASYGIDGPKNTSAEGVASPIVYGTFRYGGNVLDNYVENNGDTQYLSMLFHCGEGPIAGMSDIEINGQPSANFKNVEVDTSRLGTEDQLPLTWFTDTVSPLSVGHIIDQSWWQVSTGTIVDKVRLDFSAPGGMYDVDGHGDSHTRYVSIYIEYSVAGANSWHPLPLRDVVSTITPTDTYYPVRTWDETSQTYILTTYTPTGSEFRDGDEWSGLIYPPGYSFSGDAAPAMAIGSYIGTAGVLTTIVMSGNQHNAVRRSITSVGLPQGNYDIRVKRADPVGGLTNPNNGDVIYWADVNQIKTEPIAYRSTALLALKIQLDDQLNGIPTVTHLNYGKLINVWDSTSKTWKFQASSNPAWIVFDILTNKRYGGGAARARFNINKWIDWADFCTTNALEFNGVFDTTTNVWDAAQKVARSGHAGLLRSGTKYDIVIERASSPVMMFTNSNIVSGTFKESWMSMQDRANVVEGTYYDKLDSYKSRTIRRYDAAALANSTPEKVAQVDLMGVTNAQQAWNDLSLVLNMNRSIQRSIEFSAAIDSIACSVGDVVLVQHDMPQWGFAGRTEASNTVSVVNLDRPVTMTYGLVYSVLVHQPVLQRYASTVASVLNTAAFTQVTLNGYDGVNTVKKLVIGGVEYPVNSTFGSGGSYGVTVDATTAITTGAAYALWDMDVIETRQVVNPAVSGTPATTTQLTTTAPLSRAPAQYTNWMFGATNQVAKPFRIRAIKGSHDYQRDITALEYNASVYDPAGSVPTINYSSLDIGVTQVTITGASEQNQTQGSTYNTGVTVSYESAQGTYKTANVYLSRNGGAFDLVGNDPQSVRVDGAQYEVLTFKVQAVNVLGESAPYSNAPTFSYTVVGRVHAASDVTGLAYIAGNAGFEISWNAPSDADWQSTVLRYGTTEIFRGKATAFTWPYKVVGTYTVIAKNANPGAESATATAASVTIPVVAPNAPSLGTTYTQGFSAQFSWTTSQTSIPIDFYDVRVGTITDTFDTANQVAKVAGNTLYSTYTAPAAGAYTVFVRATDKGGNISAVSSQVFAASTIAGTGGSFYALDITVYKQAAGAPINPSGGSYTFSGDVFVAPSGWTREIPTSATIPTWASRYLFTGNGQYIAIPGPVGSTFSTAINESYADGMGVYSVFSGVATPYSIVTGGTQGTVMSVVGTAGIGPGQIQRTFNASNAAQVKFLFRITSINSDDAGTVQLLNSGTNVWSFNPVKSGASRTARLTLGATEYVISTAQLNSGVWYRLAVNFSTSGAGTAVITDNVTGSVIYSTAIPTQSAMTVVNQLRFVVTQVTGTAATSVEYADIEVTPSISSALLLHFDGYNNQPSTYDSSGTGKSMTLNGTAKISTSQSKWGGSSFLSDASAGCYVSTPASTDFDPGTLDFQTEGWFYQIGDNPLQSSQKSGTLVSTNPTATNGWGLRVTTTPTTGLGITFESKAAGVSSALINSAATYTVGTWNHVCFSRIGGVGRLFLNDVLIAKSAYTASITSGSVPLTVGRNPQGGAFDWGMNGYIDDVRVMTKGFADAGPSFVAPTAAFGTSVATDSLFANVVALLQFEGANNAVTTTDASSYNRTIPTFLGTAKISTTSPLTGSGSLLLDGTQASGVALNYATELDFNGVDFVIEGRTLRTNTTGFSNLLDFRGTGPTFGVGSSWTVNINCVNGVIGVFDGPSNTGAFNSQPGVVPLNATFHWAVVRKGSTMYLYIDGDLVAKGTYNPPATHATGVRIGYNPAGLGYPSLTGRMDEVRFTRAQSRYTQRVVMPTGPLVDIYSGGWSTPVRVYQDVVTGSSISLGYTAQVFTYNSANAATPSTQVITFLATLLGGLTGSTIFSATLYDSSGASIGNATLGGTGNTRTLAIADFGSAATCVVVASLGGYQDQVTIARIRDGATGGTGTPGTPGINAIVGQLTNESSTVPASSTGTVLAADYAAAGGTFKVYDGITDKTGVGTVYSVSGTPTGGLSISIDATTGVYTISTMSGDRGTATLQVVYGGLTIQKIYDLSKGKAGTNSTTVGATGSSARIAYTVVTSSSTPSPTPSSSTVTGDSVPASNTWGMSEVWTSTVPSYGSNQTVYQTNGLYSVVAGNTVWGVPYMSTLKVGALSAISANLGSITAGDITGVSLAIGSAPALSGTTMTGSGLQVATDGKFVVGNAATNIAFDGTVLTLNGNVVATGNLAANAATISAYALSAGNTAIATIVVPAGQGGQPFIVIGSIAVNYGGFTQKVLVDGVEVRSESVAAGTIPSLTWAGTFAAGTHTVTVTSDDARNVDAFVYVLYNKR